MKLYAFQHSYLNGIQAGIQTQHCTARMFVKYQPTLDPNPLVDMLYEWGTYFETTVIVKGGSCDDLDELYDMLSTMQYPFACFEEPALDNAITNVSVIVPTNICEAADAFRRGVHDDIMQEITGEQFTPAEFTLIQLLAKARTIA